jgi:uncharacterized glyoxalase superfamily protein PhnB
MIDNSSASPSHDTPALEAIALAASISVKDLDVSLAWYCDVMGFAVSRRYEHGGALRAVALKAGTIELLIGKDDGAKGVDRVKGQGFSLQLSTRQNIDQLAKEIQSRGGVLAADPMDTPWGGRAFRLQDPDGFKWVISSERKE